MENFTKKLNQKLRSVTTNMVTRDASEWPPGCFTLVYQPIRPLRREKGVADEKMSVDRCKR